jgi:hypothetical protein
MDQHQPPSSASPPVPQAEPGLYSIVYVSTAVRRLQLTELMPLLEVARLRNAGEGITGVLLYADGAFMQYLEGPAAGLSRIYSAIKAHPLHYGMVDLVREPVAQRVFPEWSMAFHLAGGFGQASPVEQDALLASRLADATQPPSVACMLLQKFWARGRESVAVALLNHRRTRPRRPLGSDLDTGTGD